ncbi:hypothetical protein CPAR01_11098 [Colletotrichum paranaense]|uniref:Uncharacterized protein n=2 Tax=Colletotrichum acutatum species complex TaxID=2707335 RepID=A0AAI9UZ80_9PEZI|nr:uncharacterized protein CPAR01_11098 [Colletotrichum paranaense]KAK1465722.1 hypothetical protein CMEL01_11714 [Colletotrichum melonis]KAK1531449.1 hypothetical protein CPAR01_11098 [Colletotrichum paranaense]
MSPALKRPHAIQYTGAGFFSQKGGHLGGRHQRVIGLIWQSPGLVSPGRPLALRTYAIRYPWDAAPNFPVFLVVVCVQAFQGVVKLTFQRSF